jgi:hypothetical protein
MELLEREQELFAVVRNMLPASREELAEALVPYDVKPSGVAGVVRHLRKSGYAVSKRDGLYRGADQLDEHELKLLEHRYYSYLATLSETAGAQFPSERHAEIARMCAIAIDGLNAEAKRARRAITLQSRIERDRRELAELVAS